MEDRPQEADERVQIDHVGSLSEQKGESPKVESQDAQRRASRDHGVETATGGKEGETSRIIVAVRVRPMLEKEIATQERMVVTAVETVGDTEVVLLTKEPRANDFLRMKRSRERQFAFDFVFGPSSTQQEVHEKTTKGLISGVLNGYNATVFAYGATGAGKTHTMLGTPEQTGIMGRTLQDLFKAIDEDTERDSKVTLSYLEIYNENVRDLLNPSDMCLDLREDSVKGITVNHSVLDCVEGLQVAGITELQVTSAANVVELLAIGNENRTTEPTAANETSSRSHAVLQVTVETREVGPNTEVSLGTVAINLGKLSLVDLAGSERAAATQNRGLRMVEGANINRSLLALANCINALSKQKERKERTTSSLSTDVPDQEGFVPYRDSKLTRLLKDSLGGHCRTIMITNVAPTASAYEETHNSLKYANRAKNIKTRLKRNVVPLQVHVAQYQGVIEQLQLQVSVLKHELAGLKGQRGLGGVDPVLSASCSPSFVFDVHARARAQATQADSKALPRSVSDPCILQDLKTSAAVPLHAIAASVRAQFVHYFRELLRKRLRLINLDKARLDEMAIVQKLKAEQMHWERLAATGSEEEQMKAKGQCSSLARRLEQHQQLLTTNESDRTSLLDSTKRIDMAAKRLLEGLPMLIKSPELRALLTLEFKLYSVELTSTVQRELATVHAAMVRARDLDIARLERQLQIRDELIRKIQQTPGQSSPLPQQLLLSRHRAHQLSLPPRLQVEDAADGACTDEYLLNLLPSSKLALSLSPPSPALVGPAVPLSPLAIARAVPKANTAIAQTLNVQPVPTTKVATGPAVRSTPLSDEERHSNSPSPVRRIRASEQTQSHRLMPVLVRRRRPQPRPTLRREPTAVKKRAAPPSFLMSLRQRRQENKHLQHQRHVPLVVRRKPSVASAKNPRRTGAHVDSARQVEVKSVSPPPAPVHANKFPLLRSVARVRRSRMPAVPSQHTHVRQFRLLNLSVGQPSRVREVKIRDGRSREVKIRDSDRSREVKIRDNGRSRDKSRSHEKKRSHEQAPTFGVMGTALRSSHTRERGGGHHKQRPQLNELPFLAAAGLQPRTAAAFVGTLNTQPARGKRARMLRDRRNRPIV